MKPRFECRVDLVVAALRPWEVKIARIEVQAALMGLLGALRRALAGDSSVHLSVGTLAHFDAACANLGVPPLAVLSAPEGELMNLSFEGRSGCRGLGALGDQDPACRYPGSFQGIPDGPPAGSRWRRSRAPASWGAGAL